MPHILRHRKRIARSGFDVGFGRGGALASAPATTRTAKVLTSMVEQRLAAGVGPTNIRAAVMTGGKGLAVRAVSKLVSRPRVVQLQSILRQQLARVPGTAKVAGVAAGIIGAERAIEATTGRSPARMVFDLTQGRGRDVFDTGVRQVQARGRAMPGQQLAVQHVAVRQWQTFPGGPIFTRFADGHIEVQKKDGTVKHFRPYRPVVIPRKWDARSMRRVATALKRQRKTATKILQLTGGVPKRTVRVGRAVAHPSVDV